MTRVHVAHCGAAAENTTVVHFKGLRAGCLTTIHHMLSSLHLEQFCLML